MSNYVYTRRRDCGVRAWGPSVRRDRQQTPAATVAVGGRGGGLDTLPDRMKTMACTGPVSASSALLTTSWYQRGKSDACDVKTAMSSGYARDRRRRGPDGLIGPQSATANRGSWPYKAMMPVCEISLGMADERMLGEHAPHFGAHVDRRRGYGETSALSPTGPPARRYRSRS